VDTTATDPIGLSFFSSYNLLGGTVIVTPVDGIVTLALPFLGASMGETSVYG